MDSLGAKVSRDDFVVTGTAVPSLFGVCEASYKEELTPEELLDTLRSCMQNAMERDCLTGGDIAVHVITPQGLVSRRFPGRLD